MPTRMHITTLVWISVLLQGCASSASKEKVFGKDLPTIKQVYQQKLGGQSGPDRVQVKRAIHHKDGDLTGDLRHTYQDLRQQFPLLPNPVLLLYVYPHLTVAGRPVPGYHTVFPFYTQDQYALPGEVTFPEPPKLDK